MTLPERDQQGGTDWEISIFHLQVRWRAGSDVRRIRSSHRCIGRERGGFSIVDVKGGNGYTRIDIRYIIHQSSTRFCAVNIQKLQVLK